jgi:hypothetical protein
MTTTWRFEDGEDDEQFEEDVRAYLPAVLPALQRALVEILDNPLANPCAVVRGQVVFIKHLSPSLVSTEVVPALLLTYTALQRERLIRKLGLFRAADVAPNGILSTDDEIYRALERVVDTALRRAHHRHDH